MSELRVQRLNSSATYLHITFIKFVISEYVIFAYFIGTCKINNNCTSTIKASQLKDGKIHVNTCFTHYGHEKDIHHISLTKRQRQHLASKLQQGVSKDKIMDEIRDNFGSEFQRIHLLERRDLHNIRHAFGLDDVQRHSNDQDSVLAWIKEWESSQNNPVLYYKLQGHDSGNDTLKKSDFMIVIQTEHQKNLVSKFGANGVCADSTHGTTGYDFSLTTLLVVDEFGEGQPVAWCLSNKETEEFMKLFLQKVKQNCGRVEAVWFMGDIAPQFYEAFCSANECTPKRLYCTWHVDKAWKEELRKKIGNLETEAEIYKMLRTVLEQVDEKLFDDYLSSFIDRLESSTLTEKFAAYFKSYWVDRKQCWGFCYRVGDSINTNMFCESFHKVFKYQYLKGKYNKRVDSCLVNLIKYNRDKTFERLIKLTKGKSTQRMRLMMERHNKSTEMSFDMLHRKQSDDSESTEKWDVRSDNGKNTYIITVLRDVCNEKSCNLKCPDCFACCHVQHCTCPDFLLKNISCKHIHLLRRMESRTKVQPTDRNDEFEFSCGNYLQDELCASLSTLRKEEKKENIFEVCKQKIKRNLESLIQELNMCGEQDIEAVKHLDKQVNAAKHTFQSLRKYKLVSKLQETTFVPHNKKIDTQLNFYSTKKKRKQNSNVRYAKPTIEEKEELFKEWRKGFKPDVNMEEKSMEKDNGLNVVVANEKLIEANKEGERPLEVLESMSHSAKNLKFNKSKNLLNFPMIFLNLV